MQTGPWRRVAEHQLGPGTGCSSRSQTSSHSLRKRNILEGLLTNLLKEAHVGSLRGRLRIQEGRTHSPNCWESRQLSWGLDLLKKMVSLKVTSPLRGNV